MNEFIISGHGGRMFSIKNQYNKKGENQYVAKKFQV